MARMMGEGVRASGFIPRNRRSRGLDRSLRGIGEEKEEEETAEEGDWGG